MRMRIVDSRVTLARDWAGTNENEGCVLAMATCSEHQLALQQRLECAEGLHFKADELRKQGKIQGMQKITKQIQSEMAMLKNVNSIATLCNHDQ